MPNIKTISGSAFWVVVSLGLWAIAYKMIFEPIGMILRWVF